MPEMRTAATTVYFLKVSEIGASCVLTIPSQVDISFMTKGLLFPVISGEGMSSVYRVSVTLKEEVKSTLLQQAVE